MFLAGFLAWCALPLCAAERLFDFSQFPQNQTPPGFRSTAAGSGKPGDWKVVMDEVPPVLEPLSAKAPVVTKRAVLAQLARHPADEHFPMLIFEEETFGDFTLTTRFKTVGGAIEQMAGIAFRVQDERNFYVIRASSLGNTFRFYKVVDGQRGPLIGPEIEIPKGVWHEMTIECKGNHIRALLNGKEVIPQLTDKTFTTGKIAFWTKSDSVSYFADTKLVYTPRIPLAQTLVQEAVRKYPRVVGLRIYAITGADANPRVVASKDESEIGLAGAAAEQDVIRNGKTYYGKGKDTVTLTLPLRDRNGDPIAAARVVLKSFPGQTEQNALVRAQPIVKQMQARVQSLAELVQ